MRDERLPPFLLHSLVGALVLYWLVVQVRCGEDECIDRPVVAGIASAFWLAGGTIVACSSSAAIRWAAATFWVFAAVICLLFLTAFAFNVVYD